MTYSMQLNQHLTVPRVAVPAPHLAPAIETLPSTALLKGHPVVRIEHNGALYQLRSTKLGKLILTK